MQAAKNDEIILTNNYSMPNKTNKEISDIIKYLYDLRGFDFRGNNPEMLSRRINHRLAATANKSLVDYLEFLNGNDSELDNLIDSLTINVSRFFRDSFCFEYIASMLLPEIISHKISSGDRSLRVWSAGCSSGEEPYSIAIIINELLEKEKTQLDVKIFASDLDKKILTKANKGEYSLDSVRDVKTGLLNKYFTKGKECYTISDEIKNMVSFSFFDLLDKKNIVPQESIFGNFDIVLCRNVLIYFNLEHQEIIFDKISKSIRNKGYLILGEAELPTDNISDNFRRESAYCKTFIKK